VMQVYGLAGFEVPTTAAGLDYRHVVQVEGGAVGELLKPNRRRVVEQRSLSLFEGIELGDQVRELLSVVAIDGLELFVYIFHATPANLCRPYTMRQRICVHGYVERREAVVGGILEHDDAAVI